MEPKFTVRDLLAFDRTMLANERTFLAYLRTFVGLVASGAALMKLFEFNWAHVFAAVFLVCAPICLLIGIVHYISTNRRIRQYSPD